MDAPLNKLSIESKIIEFGVRSKKLWLFLRGDLCCPVELRILREFSGESGLSGDSGKMSGISGTFESNG
jgi:hypothetical protein